MEENIETGGPAFPCHPEISKLMAQQNAEPQEPTKPKRHMVKGEAA